MEEILSKQGISTTTNQLKYKPTKKFLPNDIFFNPSDFIRPIQGVDQNTVALLKYLMNSVTYSGVKNISPITKVVECLVIYSFGDGVL